jgi:hypothetical protein
MDLDITLPISVPSRSPIKMATLHVILHGGKMLNSIYEPLMFILMDCLPKGQRTMIKWLSLATGFLSILFH